MTKLILASKSPRRQELLKQLGFKFEIVVKEVDESFPAGLSPEEAVLFIVEKKAQAFTELADALVIVADTIVTLDHKIIGKPADRQAAFDTLRHLSGRKHQVITAVGLLRHEDLRVFSETTDVYVNNLTDQQINFYVDHYKPYDKAGAYGIQDWIGLVAIEKITGSYTNVVGLPTARLYDELTKLL